MNVFAPACGRPARSHHRCATHGSLSGKLCSCLAALALAASLVPSPAWAQGTADGPKASLDPVEQQRDAPAAAIDPDAGAAVAPDPHETAPEGTEPTPPPDPTEAALPSADPGETGSAGQQATSEETSPSLESQDAPSEAASDAQDADAYAVGPMDYVLVQASQDQQDLDRRIGEVREGDVLWANVFDFFSDDVMAHEAAWSYQWLAAPNQSDRVQDYAPIPGQTAQSIAFTKELSRQLEGSYLAVKVTAGETELVGPGSFGFEGASTPGPVVAPPSVTASASVIGITEDGSPQIWAGEASYTLDEGATAADVSEALFEKQGIAADFGTSSYGWFLSTITSPFDGRTLGWDAATGRSWALFVNGEYSATKGAGDVVLQPGDTVSWFYTSGQTLPGTLSASADVIGIDADGNPQTWAPSATYSLLEGATAADVSEALFEKQGIAADFGTSSYGWFLSTITSPFDGRTLGWDAATGRYWALFVNGEYSATKGAGDVVLQPGDTVSWFYTSGQTLPDTDGVVVDPSAPRPGYESSWPGFGNGPQGSVVVDRLTPTQGAELAWTTPYRPPGTDPGTGGGVSDPLIVNGDIYLVCGDELRRIDATTGEVEASRKIGGSVRYFCRPAYVDGVIVVPTDALTLSAFTADTLTCVWRTSLPLADAGDYQALSTLTVGDGQVFAGFTVPSSKGALMCVRISDGKLMWSQTADSAQTGEAAGYYWAGAALSGTDILIGDEAGKVSLVDGATGEAKSSVSLGAPVRAGIVEVPEDGRSATEGTYLAVANDGTLHKIVRSGNALSLAGSVPFAQRGSTSTPAVHGGKAYVCGAGEGWKGVLCIVDIASMALERTVQTDGGESKSAPLVSVQGGDTYVYFTCNSLPGGVWGYRVGDENAYLLFDPPAEQQNYCTASVVADEFGNLYYTNDSGYLIALKGKPGALVTFDSNGGSTVSPSYVAIGNPATVPAEPVRPGYAFLGWYEDEAGTQKWDFSKPVTARMTLWAQWKEKAEPAPPPPYQPPTNSRPPFDPPVRGGFVPAARTPISAAAPAGTPNDEKIGDAKAVTSSEPGKKPSDSARSDRPGERDAQGARPSESGASTTLNPWAVGGIAVGVAGLAGAATLGGIAWRRSKTTASGSKKGD